MDGHIVLQLLASKDYLQLVGCDSDFARHNILDTAYVPFRIELDVHCIAGVGLYVHTKAIGDSCPFREREEFKHLCEPLEK